MAQSLLAHLYTRIKGSQEDVATLSLQYILSQSNDLNKAFTKQLEKALHTKLDPLQYTCQSVGEKRERPDFSGVDFFGKEQVLCEMKFYAGLTENQPLGYIDRLKNEGGKGLLFICPKTRKTLLWIKLKNICTEANREVKQTDEHFMQVDGVNVAITTWSEILNHLNEVASSLSLEGLSDIKQLVGFCAQMDSDAFIPFVAEDLTSDNAKKIDRFYQVVDETIKLLKSDDTLKTSSQGLRASSVWDGYTRFLYVDDVGISLTYDRSFWKNNSSIETPFWLHICDIIVSNSVWNLSPKAQECLLKIPDSKKEGEWLALEPLTNATLDEVCQDLKGQILEYLDAFR